MNPALSIVLISEEGMAPLPEVPDADTCHERQQQDGVPQHQEEGPAREGTDVARRPMLIRKWRQGETPFRAVGARACNAGVW